MSRIAIVVQRYGIDVNGGAELHARLVAGRLMATHDVVVLTSRALDYHRWTSHYPAGETTVDGVRVIRFDHPPRANGWARLLPLAVRWRWRKHVQKRFDTSQPHVARPTGRRRGDGHDHLRAKGPTMDGLIEHLREHRTHYDAVIFFSAVFHPAAAGVLEVPERALLVPTLHDEKSMFLPIYHRVFRAPRRILYNTTTEAALARTLYGDDLAPGSIVGVGIELPDTNSLPVNEAAASPWHVAHHKLTGPYALYLGRVDEGKGCGELITLFLRWRAARGSSMQLVLAGHVSMARHHDPALVYTGFVDAATRDALIERAQTLVVPSRHESLSLVALEALAHGCPLVANAGSPVLAQHVEASGAGRLYADAPSFDVALDAVLSASPEERAQTIERGRAYVQEHYAWPAVMAKIEDAIAACRAPARVGEDTVHSSA